MKSLKKQSLNSLPKELLLTLIFFVFALFIETVTFLILGFNALPEYILLDLSILLMIAGGIFLIPSFKVQQILYIIVIVFQIVLSYANVTLYNIFGTVITVDMVNLIVEAGTAIESSVLNFNIMLIYVLLALVFIATSILFDKMYDKNTKTIKPIGKVKLAIIILTLFVSSQFLGYYGFTSQLSNLSDVSAYNYVGDDQSLYSTLIFEAESLKKFGTYGFYFQDINSTLFNLENNREERIELATNYVNAGELSSTNAYTGISEGNNLIVIMAESLEWYAISEELTPTLYGLSQNNVSMNNYYSKSKTNISEAFGFLGSYPLTQSFVSYLPGVAKLTNNQFLYSLPNLLKEQNYEGINYFINHKKEFYKRTSTHTRFGFNNLYDISDFNVVDSEISHWVVWPLDSEFFTGAIDDIIPVDGVPFFNWVTTMSTHGPYEGNYRLEPYLDIIDNSNWVNVLENTTDEEHLKNYVAAVMDLDRAVQYLMDELSDRGLLETTTIVLYADHETYYHELGLKVKGIDRANYQNAEIYRVPFMIYDDNLSSMQINDFTCPYDILPTILDLLGIVYNKNMYMGNSVLNETEVTKAFLSLTGGIFNPDIFTINGVDLITNSQEVTETEKEQFLEDIEALIQKVLIFNDLYNYNLF